jgi:hypothetical protein
MISGSPPQTGLVATARLSWSSTTACIPWAEQQQQMQVDAHKELLGSFLPFHIPHFLPWNHTPSPLLSLQQFPALLKLVSISPACKG